MSRWHAVRDAGPERLPWDAAEDRPRPRRQRGRRPENSIARPAPADSRLSRRETLCEPEPGRVERVGRGTARWGRHALPADCVEALRAVGAFGVAEVSDLRAFFETAARSRQGILDLRKQRLLRVQQFCRGEATLEVASLTKTGKRLLQQSIDPRDADDSDAQRYRARPARGSQVLHDAAVFRAARLEIRDIEGRGGRAVRVRTDGDLKRLVCRRVGGADRARADADASRAAAAKELGLAVVDGNVIYPDVRIEYERDGEGDHTGAAGWVDVEVTTRDYRASALQAKADAGFRLYRMGADGSVVRSDA